VSEIHGLYFYLYLYALSAVEDSPCSSTRSIRISTSYAISCTEGSLVLTSISGNSARAQLIKTRRGTWIDESLLPAARRECLGVLREAARKAVGEDTYLPGWISEGVESADLDLELLSFERFRWEYSSAEQKLNEEVWAAIDELRAQGVFEGLDSRERLDLEDAVEEHIRSERGAQIVHEIEEARNKKLPKSNPTLITEKDMLNSTLDVLHRRGVLDEILLEDYLRAPLEEDEAQALAREASKTATVCGCCGRKLPSNEPAFFGAKVYVGMWALYWDRVSKPQICKPRLERTVLCGSCAPEWLSPDRDDVVMQLCGQCERPMVERLQLSKVHRMFCSDPCRQAYHNQLGKEKRAEERKKVCEVCGEAFTASRRDAKTCSDGCKQKAYRRRKKEVHQNR
jgi:hypothetical protein